MSHVNRPAIGANIGEHKGRSGSAAFSRYTKALIGTAFLVLLTWFAVVSLIDPYGIIGTPANAYTRAKPTQIKFARVYKPIDFLRGSYNGIILGASPAQLAFDPTHPALVGAGYHIYNFAMVEERPYEMAELAKFAFSVQPIKLVIISLDFTRYNVSPAALDDHRIYYPTNANILWWSFAKAGQLMISPNSMRDSYTTIADNTPKGHEEGFKPGGQFFSEAANPSVNFNYLGNFSNRLRFFDQWLLPKVAALSPDWAAHGFDHSPIRSILLLAATQGARVIILIDPDHALEMELLRHRGLWPAFERWKHELACVADRTPAKFHGEGPEVWDFSGYTEWTTEPLVNLTGKGLDYWDPVHFATRLGDRILTTIFRPTAEETSDGVGVRLDAAHVLSHLRAVRDAAVDYEAKRTDDVAWLASILGNGAADSPLLPRWSEIDARDCRELVGPS